MGPVTIDKFSLPLTRRRRGAFFNKIQLHGALTYLAFKGRDLGFIFRDNRCLGRFGAAFCAVVLGPPQLHQMGRQGVFACGITPTDGASADVLAQLDLELRRMAPVGTS